jgi:hypothetical protein
MQARLNHDSDARDALPSNVLFFFGMLDLLRGVLHTFFVHWAAQTFAKLDLSAAGQDQLMLLSAFGASNLLTGMIYILVSRRAKALSKYVLLLVPCAYALGLVGMKLSDVTPEAAFLGKYFMFAYFGICLATFAFSTYRWRSAKADSRT